MNNTVTILIVALIALAGYIYVSSENVAAQPVSAPAPVSAHACYNQATGAVSAGWAGLNKAQRAYMGMVIISECEATR